MHYQRFFLRIKLWLQNDTICACLARIVQVHTKRKLCQRDWLWAVICSACAKTWRHRVYSDLIVHATLLQRQWVETSRILVTVMTVLAPATVIICWSPTRDSPVHLHASPKRLLTAVLVQSSTRAMLTQITAFSTLVTIPYLARRLNLL